MAPALTAASSSLASPHSMLPSTRKCGSSFLSGQVQAAGALSTGAAPRAADASFALYRFSNCGRCCRCYCSFVGVARYLLSPMLSPGYIRPPYHRPYFILFSFLFSLFCLSRYSIPPGNYFSCQHFRCAVTPAKQYAFAVRRPRLET
jgi:hypothetical protein